MASPDPRPGAARRIHFGRRGTRHHRADRGMGAAAGLRRGRNLARPPARGGQPVAGAVPRQTLLETVTDVLQTCGIAPRRLELEITELVLLQDDKSTLATFGALHDLGVRSRWTISAPAIRRSAICAASLQPIKSTILRPRLARATIASRSSVRLSRSAAILAWHDRRGRRDEEQFEFLAGAGCAEVQGYLFSRPVPAGRHTRIDRTVFQAAGFRVGPGRR